MHEMAVKITGEVLRIYAKYGGDLDGFARMAGAEERAVLSDAGWHAIDVLVSSVSHMKRGLVSPEYAERIRRSLREQCLDEAVMQALIDMA